MKIKKTPSIVLSSLFIVLFATGPLQAANITTHAEYTRSPDPTVQDNDVGNSGTITSEVAVGSIIDWSGGTAAAAGNTAAQTAASASYLGAYPNDYPFHDASASVQWSEDYSIGSSGAYTWDFSITGGELAIYDWCTGPSMTAQYSIEIFANGTSVWNSSAILNGGKVGYTLTETGTDIGGTLFGYDGTNLDSIFGFTYDSYQGSVALGTYNAGDTISLSYILSVGASGPSYETGAGAFFGDPGDLAGNPGMHGSLSSVPIPGALWLFAPSLLGLLGLRRKSAS